MNDKQMSQIMNLLAKDLVTEDTDLWPAIQKRLVMGNKLSQKGDVTMNTKQKSINALRVTVASLLTLSVLALLLFFTPQGKVFAQQVLQFFLRSTSDALPVQSWQLTPLPTAETTTPDPASILDANLTVAEAEQQSGFHVLQPASIPDSLAFVGASFDTTNEITRIFYQSPDSNSLIVKQELIQNTEACQLCGEVGASAEVEDVTIGSQPGEYVVGVWKLTDSGPVWNADPFLQTMRWQKDGMAFELMYMGSPDMLSKADMIAIAESLQ